MEGDEQTARDMMHTNLSKVKQGHIKPGHKDTSVHIKNVHPSPLYRPKNHPCGYELHDYACVEEQPGMKSDHRV